MLKITWSEYIQDLATLRDNILASEASYDAVIGIPRGGVIPAVYLSHQLGVPYFEASPKDLLLRGNFLVVDDLIDSGKTLHKCTHDIAVVYWKTVPDQILPTKGRIRFYGRELPNEWIMFPYENGAEG